MNSRTKAAHFLELLCVFFNTERGAKFDFLSLFLSFLFLFLSFLGGERGLCSLILFIFLETIQTVLGYVDCFLAISLFPSFTRFLSVLTSCFWSSNNLFFCCTEILDVLVGNKFISFCLSRKLRGNGEGVLKSGMAGGFVGYRCVGGGRQNSAGRGNGKREYIFYLFI